jgi:hypothetical protein
MRSSSNRYFFDITMLAYRPGRSRTFNCRSDKSCCQKKKYIRGRLLPLAVVITVIEECKLAWEFFPDAQ